MNSSVCLYFSLLVLDVDQISHTLNSSANFLFGYAITISSEEQFSICITLVDSSAMNIYSIG